MSTTRIDEFLYRYALLKIKGIGPIVASKLLQKFESATLLYRQSEKELKSQINSKVIQNAIIQKKFIAEAEKEIQQMEKDKIYFLFPEEEDYPYALKNTPDAPIILYYKGQPTWNTHPNIAVVGTRKATTYGIKSTQKIIEALAEFPCQIISGLALGVDAMAHQTALQHHMKTYAVLAHGLNRVYPEKNETLSQSILEKGALLSEYPTQHPFIRENFLQRNRIIAGMSLSTIIVESKFGGGAMTTAKYAFNYDRNLYAVPGKMNDIQSQGCNFLIKNMQAQLLLDPQEVYQWFGTSLPQQKELIIDLSKEEKNIVDTIQKHEKIQIDELALSLNTPTFRLMPLLLELEFKEVILALPGKFYAIR